MRNDAYRKQQSRKADWLGIIRDMMQMQYDAENLAGYAKYKQFWDSLE